MVWRWLVVIVGNEIAPVFISGGAACPSIGGGFTTDCSNFFVRETLPATLGMLSSAPLASCEVFNTCRPESAAAVTWWVDGIPPGELLDSRKYERDEGGGVAGRGGVVHAGGSGIFTGFG